MKKISISILLVISFLSCVKAQNDSICGIFPQKEGIVFYTGVIGIDSLSAKQFYLNTKIWISGSFGSAKTVTEADVENSFLSIKGFVNLLHDKNLKLKFTMNFYFKDYRLKYEVTDIYFLISAINSENRIEKVPAVRDCFLKTASEFDATLKSVIESYVTKMKSLSNDW
jgi:hypothetical protein